VAGLQGGLSQSPPDTGELCRRRAFIIEWVSGRIQYISWFDTLQDAEDWIENNARSWVSSARNRL
jgi:hypothetical protein